jgi:hypothetical protein
MDPGKPMRLLAPVISALLFVAIGQTSRDARNTAANPLKLEQTCAPLGTLQTRTTLYFGLSRIGGAVTESEWRTFLREEVTPRFPEGLTVWEADGQWRKSDGRIGRERAKVLLLVHEQSQDLRPAIASIVQRYKALFQQRSVLWETSPVCAAF